jgi:hypothetical protein
MNRDKFFSVIFVAIMLIGTVGFVLVSEPEEMSVGSADGRVNISGVTRRTQPFSVSMGSESVKTPLLSPSYRVEPSAVTLDNPATLTFSLPDESNGYTVYHFNETTRMWEESLPVVSYAEQKISVNADELGVFSLGEKETVTAPQFLSVYDELITMAPANAVGYETHVGYKRADGEIVSLRGVGDAGGCGGVNGQGEGQEFSTREREANVFINDVTTPVTFVFLTRWLTSENGGCSAEKPLQHLAKYDILPQ